LPKARLVVAFLVSGFVCKFAAFAFSYRLRPKPKYLRNKNGSARDPRVPSRLNAAAKFRQTIPPNPESTIMYCITPSRAPAPSGLLGQKTYSATSWLLVAAATLLMAAVSPIAMANTASLVVSGQTNLTAAGTYNPNGAPTTSNDVVFSGAYSPATFTAAGTGISIGDLDDLSTTATLTIGSGNAGNITLNGGANSEVGTGGVLASDLIYVPSGDTLTIDGTTTFANTNAGQTLNVNGTLNFSTVVSAPAGVTYTKNGTGTLSFTLPSSSGYPDDNFANWVLAGGTMIQGQTTMTTGTITMGVSGSSANVTVEESANHNFADTILVAAGDTGSMAIEGSLAAGTPTITGAIILNNSVTFGGAGSSDGIGQSGPISGSGAITINAAATGAVNFRGSNTDTSAITVTSGTFLMGGSGATNANNTVAIASGAFMDIQHSVTVGGLNNTTSGGTVENSTATATILTLGGTGTYTFGGPITAATPANLGLTVALTGSGNQTLSGASSYAGATAINGGTLYLTGALNGATSITVNGGNLTESAAGSIATGASTLTISSTTGSTVVTLSGANTYSGGTTVTAGELLVNNTSGSATGTAGVALNGGTLAGSGTIAGALTIGGGTVAPGAVGVNLTVGGLVFNSGTMSFTLNGTGSASSLITTPGATFNAIPVINLTVSNITSGEVFTLLNSSTPIVDNGFLTSLAPTTIGRITLTPAESGNTIIATASGSAANLIWAGGVAGLGTGTASQGDGATWNNTQNNSGSNWNNGGHYDYFYDLDNVTFNDTGAPAHTVNLTTVNFPSSVTVNTASSYTFTGPGSIAGVGNVAVTSGTLNLDTANSYSGGTSISAGADLVTGAASALPGTGTVTVKGTLDLSGDNQTIGALSDGGVTTGVVQSSSASPATLTANNGGSISSNLALNNAVVSVGGGTLNLTGTLAGNATSNFANGAAFTESSTGVISGAGMSFTNNAGTASLAGLNTYTGSTIINAGTVAITGAGQLDGGTYAGNIANNGVFSYGSSLPQTLSGVISGAGTVTEAGPGTLTISNAQTYTGATTVSGGTLNYQGTLGASPATGGGQISVGVAGGGTAQLNIPSTAAITLSSANFLVGNGATGTDGQGFVYQSTGSSVSGVNHLRLGAGVSGSSYGYYNLSGGTLGTTEVDIGGPSDTGVGVFDMSGGTLNVTNLYLAEGANGFGTLNLTGGTINVTGGLGTNGTATGNALVLNISNASLLAGPATLSLASSTTTTLGEINLLSGGLLETAGLAPSANSAESTLNFNGGTLKASGPSTTFISGPANNVNVVNIYSGGATIDNSGYAISLTKILSSPAGSADTSDGLNSAVTIASGGSGYQGAPAVTFSGGGGVGAAGYAVVSGGVVTNIVITSPGTGYTTAPTITLTGGGYTSAASATAPTPTLNTSGGVTFVGSGTTTATRNETYTGPTAVSGGTLIVTGSLGGTSALSVTNGAADLNLAFAINETANVTLTSGTLATLANLTQYFGSLALAGGNSQLTYGATGSIFNFLDSSTLTWNGTLTIYDWNGNGADLGGAGSDQLFIGSTNDLTAAQLADITFVNGTEDSTLNFSTLGAVQLSDGEIVAAVPEPGDWVSLVFGFGILALWRRRSRRWSA